MGWVHRCFSAWIGLHTLAPGLVHAQPEPPASAAPEPDFDHDGVPDAVDDCPTDPGPKETGGCQKQAAPSASPKKASPAPEVAKVEADHLVLPRPVEFERGSARLAQGAEPLIAALATAVARLPAARHLIVRGHTDDKGARAANILLSRRRAESVVKALAEHGVDRARLEAQGVGPDEPVADNGTETGRAKNRRVEFRLLDVDLRLPGQK
ncbi:MAG: OmpA family protein [Myxococcota bacterium]